VTKPFDRLPRPGHERDHPFPQPHDAGEKEKPREDPASAVERATVLVGPALILTTFVRASGLAALVLSDLPALRLFGWLSALVMLAALVA